MPSAQVVDIGSRLQWTNSKRFSTWRFSSNIIRIHVNPQDYSERLLSKEWLVKIDNEKSVPYLMVRPSESFMVKLGHTRRLGTSPSRSYTQLWSIKHASS